MEGKKKRALNEPRRRRKTSRLRRADESSAILRGVSRQLILDRAECNIRVALATNVRRRASDGHAEIRAIRRLFRSEIGGSTGVIDVNGSTSMAQPSSCSRKDNNRNVVNQVAALDSRAR